MFQRMQRQTYELRRFRGQFSPRSTFLNTQVAIGSNQLGLRKRTFKDSAAKARFPPWMSNGQVLDWIFGAMAVSFAQTHSALQEAGKRVVIVGSIPEIPQEALLVCGGIAGGPGFLTGQIQRAAAALGKILLRQNAHADLPRNDTYCQGQNDQSFRDNGQPATHFQRRNLRCPSDQV